MSGIDLTEDFIAQKYEGLTPVQTPEPWAFDGFVRGTGKLAVKSAIDTMIKPFGMLAATGAIAYDTFTGGTEAQDRYFKAYDEIFDSASDFWTPRPDEVGLAGQIAGPLIGMLPGMLFTPTVALPGVYTSTAEGLLKKGVSLGKAQAVGGVMAGGMAAGLLVPILGRTLTERVLLGGAGFNLLQGTAMRGTAGAILEGTPAAGDYQAFNVVDVTLDVLMGAAFGGFAHLSPAARAEGERWWAAIRKWGETLNPADRDALLVMRQAQHAQADSLPGRPVGSEDSNAHVARVKTAVEQMLREEPVNVEEVRVPTDDGTVRAPQFEPLPERNVEAYEQGLSMAQEAERIRMEEGLPPPPQPEVPFEQRPIYQAVRQGLEDLKFFGPEEQAKNAAIVQAYFDAMARWTGRSVDELMDRYRFRLTGRLPEGGAGQMMQERTRTDTPEFRRWFGDSKVVDERGEPLVVYHGSGMDIASFDTEEGAFFTSSADSASIYAKSRAVGWSVVREESGAPIQAGFRSKAEAQRFLDAEVGIPARVEKGVAAVYPVYLTIKNPLIVDAKRTSWHRLEFEGERITTESLLDEARARGHDGVIVRNVMDNAGGNLRALSDVYAVVNPEQVKSIHNRGTFDPNDPNILRQGAVDQDQTGGYGGSREAQEAEAAGHRQDTEGPRQPEDLSATVSGRNPAQGWIGATRIRRGSAPIPLYRGAARPLSPGSFSPERLGGATGRPSSGLGVWFTPSRAEAATYGTAQEVYLDLRNPKIIRVEDLPGFETTTEATAFREQLRAQGFDSIIVKADHFGGKSSVIAFDPDQVIPTQSQPGRLYQSDRAPRFYSELQRQIEGIKQESAPPEQWKGIIKGLKGVKRDEIEWTGINEWLELQQGRVTRQQVLDFIEQNGVRVEEVLLGKTAEGVAPREPDPFTDPAITNERSTLEAAGWRIERHPEDNRVIGFYDPDANDIATAREMRTWFEHPDENGGLAPPPIDVVVAAERVDAWWRENQGGATPDLETLTDRLSNLGWTWMQRGDEVLFRDARNQDAEWVNSSDLSDDTGNPLPQTTYDLAHQIEQAATTGQQVARPTKFGQYTLPGGENYRELLLTLPEKSPTVDTSNLEIKHARNGDGYAVWEGDEQITAGAMSQRDASRMLDQIISQRTAMLPQGRFTSSHFDEPNILAHVRFNDRTDADGKRVLFIEEFQSDWAQQGKKKGFETDVQKEREALMTEANRGNDRIGYGLPAPTPERMQQITQRLQELHRIDKSVGVPRAPFVTKTDAWVGLAVKRMIAWAVENGYDKISWTRGEQQVQRYTSALRKAVDEIEWTKTDKGVQLVGYKGRGEPSLPGARENHLLNLEARGELSQREANELRRLTRERAETRQKVVDTTEREDALSDAIGKAMAQRILQDPAQSGTISGENLKIDDTGMASFYDRIVPGIARDVLRRLGVRAHTSGEKTEGAQVVRNRSLVDAKAIGDLALSKPFVDEGFEGLSAQSKRLVQAKMLALGKDDEILKAIVRAVPVDVVDMLRAQQLTPEMLFHDPSMLVNNDALKFGPDVAGGVDVPTALVRAVASVAAEAVPAGGDALRVGRAKGDSAMSTIHDAIVYDIDLPNIGKQPGFDITPEMRQKAIKGQALFQRTQDTQRGFIEFGEGKPFTVGLLANADRSTFIHESGHFFLEVTMDLGRKADAPLELKRDIDTIFKWWGVKRSEWDSMSFEERRPFHEQFARGFERYLAEGKAPTPQLQSIFDRFKEWLREVYQTLTGMNVKLSDDVRAVMGRMLGAEVERIELPSQRGQARPSLIDDIKALGGVDKGSMQDIVGEKRFGKGIKGVPWGLFKDGGKGLDDLATILRDAGWPIPDDPVDGGVQALRDMIGGELEGRRVQRLGEEGMTPEQQTEMTAEQVFADYAKLEEEAAERFNYRETPEYRNEITRIRNQRDNDLAAILKGEGDYIGAEARRAVAQNPDQAMVVGQDADGAEQTMTAREYLDRAEQEYRQALDDARLYEEAATCMMGAD